MSSPIFKGLANGLTQLQGAGLSQGGNNSAFNGLASALTSLQPFPNTRLGQGISNRDQQVMTWRLPNGAGVQMFVNPQNFEVRDNKQITYTKTKGGYVVQYWGQNLTQLNLRGTTGSSGITGINVLNDIYNAENRAFDLVAAQQTNALVQQLSDSSLGSTGFGDVVSQVANKVNQSNFILRPSLASLATSIVLFYQGVSYRGFFTEFTVTESADRLGLFDYNMTFMSTQKSGVRRNVFAWQKEAAATDAAGQLLNGLANSIRSSFGLASQAAQNWHSENAPLSFGGSSLPGELGFTQAPNGQVLNNVLL
jgi:hypothetical protein